jgi:uncharacterized protein YjiS (DUF1127 family)
MTKLMDYVTSGMSLFLEARERAVKTRVRQHLLGFSDRQLEDMGFSRDQLAQGLKSWPWRATVETYGTTASLPRTPSTTAAQTNQYEHPESSDKLAA